MELVTDFMFAIGMFAVLAGLGMIYQTAGITLLGYDTTLSFVFIGVGLLGASVYFWSKQQIVRGIPIGWEIFTSAMMGIVFVSLFILPTGQVLVPNPFQQYVPFQIYAIVSIPLVWSSWALKQFMRFESNSRKHPEASCVINQIYTWRSFALIQN